MIEFTMLDVDLYVLIYLYNHVATITIKIEKSSIIPKYSLLPFCHQFPHPQFPSVLGKHLSIFYPYSFTFSKLLHKRSHIV